MLLFISTVADTDLQKKKNEIVHFRYAARDCFRKREFAISLAVDIENRLSVILIELK